MSDKQTYTVYHLHTDYSNTNGYADSCTGFKDYIKLAKKQGMTAIAFSEHGNIADWIKKKQECDKAGIKYIHGVELYLCINLEDDDRGSHIGLYAKNWDGVLELNKLLSISTTKGKLEDKTDRHMYYNPRISLDELMHTSDNIIVTSACLASPLNKWDSDEKKESFRTLVRWMVKNKHRCFFEIQYHNHESQIVFNRKLYLYSKKTGVPLIAGTDTHSSNNYKAECRKILQIYKKSFYGEEDEFDLTWKTYDELVDAFKKQGALPEEAYMQAIQNTNVFADMIEDFKLDRAFKYPTLYGDNVREQWENLIDFNFKEKINKKHLKLPSKIKKKCEEFFKEYDSVPDDDFEKKIHETYQNDYEWANSNTDEDIIKQYKNIIDEEFNVMCKLGMESFMMFMSELITWAKENNIPCGTGRGSVCGSMIAFITNITDVDPMVWNTVFSRFCNEDRISLGDIDIDFASEDREKVYQYIIERFTPEKTAYIAAFSTLQDRGCIDVLAGGLGYKDLDKVMEIKNKFDEYFSGYNKIVQEEVNTEELVENGETDSSSITFDNHEIYMIHIAKEKSKKQLNSIKKQYDALIKDNQDLFYYLDGLKGTIVAKGTHPSGIIGSPVTLADNIGLWYKDGDSETPVSSCAMKSIDSLNYVKFDILGLKTVGIIKDACEYAGIPYLKSYDLNWNDCKVWKNMITAQQGVFQFEGDYSFSLLKDFKPTTVNHMSMVNAALRPSGKSYRDRLIAGEHNDNPSQEINDLLASNNGFLIFQEDTIKFLTDICGFSGSAADTTRRCIEEDTLILMGNGNYKKIKDIQVGDIVQSFNKYNISEPKTVINVFDNGFQKTYTITSKHGYELNVTANHPVLTQRGYVKVDDLTLDDFVMTPRRINSISDGKPSNKRLSSSDMYLIGLLIGDGSVADNASIHFTNSDIDLIEEYKRCVRNIGDNRRKSKCEFYTTMQSGVEVDTIYSVYIKKGCHLSSLIKLLEKYNLRHFASGKHIPDEFMYYPVGNKLTSLLAGLFNTDGGYNNKNNSIEYYSISHLLVIQIKSLLEKYDIYSYIQSKFISGYNYYSYTLCINQSDSLNNFDKKILPFIIGKKHGDYKKIIHQNNNNDLSYNYLLPNECQSEIINMSKITNTSINQIGRKLDYEHNCFAIKPNSSKKITDTKAKEVIKYLYCPYTYELLFADYIPVQIKSIKKNNGVAHVYDIEVEDNHNYVAGNMIVHNCIGKKDAEGLKEQLPKILDGYCKNSPKERRVAEEEAKQFVQIIQDSSEYQFGLNHSTAYSMNGYECVWLRTYHSIEFITAYLNRAENKEDINYGVELAKQYNIDIMPIKFGKSLSEYTIDRKNNAIYKGISSIKFCNSTIAEELMRLAQEKKYDSFIELLDDINEKTSVDNRQLNILTGLNFFSDFGENKYLLKVIDLYNGVKIKNPQTKKDVILLPSLRNCKQIKKDKLHSYEEYGLTEYLLQKYSEKETAKQYSQIDNIGLLKEMINKIPNKSMSVQDYVRFEKEYLQYVTYTNPEILGSYYIVIDFKVYKDTTKPYLILRQLQTGQEIKAKIKQSKIYKADPFGEFAILKIEQFVTDFKKKFIEGEWRSSDEIEFILEQYEVIKE